ncbi:TetR/AcrR family transcriptional regulator [Hoyosella rhizosphaerae]|uniref:TetR family transcriptional regulator n=1 Tax=Hoyosella rhizosphaerae TaxID=1755582 RepID=A0A916X9F0_9ACTN|nr:TetR/AcrR family transcriptional regulator [Hoyosella rhizosphaerae]MBN4927184.1 TetR/AcrR family transcriptional regulator [Hoyosella rhizosphaerae]GGC53340.1 TetR family transcriptional regulator [Hoyosella rhizosphaerae]
MQTKLDSTSAATERQYGGRSVSDRRAERRVRFVDSAITVFGERTYRGSTLSDICSHAKLSRRQFYEEFGSREELLTAAYSRIQEDARTAVLTAITEFSHAPIEETIAEVMSAYVESIAADPLRAQVAFVEVVGVSTELEALRRRQRLTWGKLLETALRSKLGETYEPPGGYMLAGQAFVGAVNNVAHEWSLSDPRPPHSDLKELFTAVLTPLASYKK